MFTSKEIVMNMKRQEWGGEIDIDAVPEDERAVALVICVGQGAPWWNFVPAAREVMNSLEQLGWQRPEGRSEDAAEE
jgi:hypothetical protein